MISLVPSVTGETPSLGDLSLTEEQRQKFINAARTAGQGMSFSTGDEIEAAIKTMIGDKSYSENIDAIRSGIKGFEDENPSASQALFWAGVLPTITVAAPKLAMTLLSRFGPKVQASILGATGMGLEGFAAGEGVKDRTSEGLAMGALGLILAPTTVVGAQLLQRAAPKVKGFLTSLKTKVTGAKLPEPQNEQEAMAKRVVEITSNARREGREELTDAEFAEVEGLYERGGREGDIKGGKNDFNDYISNNSNLPMDKTSRNQRMMEQGFEGPYYKGRSADYGGSYANVLRSKEQHMSEDPSTASTYGRNTGTVEELAVRPQLDDYGRVREPLYVELGGLGPEFMNDPSDGIIRQGANFNRIPLDAKVRFQKKKDVIDTDTTLESTIENIEAPSSDESLNSGVTTTDIILEQLDNSRPYLTNQDVVFEDVVDRGPTGTNPNIIAAERASGNPDPEAYLGSINRAVVGAPERIRRTSANFDPLLKNISNLNAAMAAGIPLGALGFFADNEEYYQDM